MKIYFDKAYGSQNVDNRATAYGQPKVSPKETNGSYRTDISGTVMDNNAYAGHGRTAEDVMAEAGQQDVVTQRNYMAVMSHSMSDEDFARLQKEGYRPGQEDIEKIVTILDRIKAELLKAGESITGYTDTLDRETLADITGSENYAGALADAFNKYDIPLTRENIEKAVRTAEEAAQLDKPDEASVKYLVRNGMEPDIRNLYMAQHGTNGQEKPSGGYYSTEAQGYYARKADTIQWERLMPAMEQAVEEASGLTEDPPTMEEAGWLIKQGIELNTENLNRLHRIRSVSFPLDPAAVLEAAAVAVADGLEPDRAVPGTARTAAEQASDLREEVLAMPEEAADAAAKEAENGVLNLRELRAAWNRLRRGYDGSAVKENPQARRMLEEVRLQMTLEANVKLIKSHYAIDTAPLEELVEALKQAQSEVDCTLFSEADKAAAGEKARLYDRTIRSAAWLPAAPAAVIGRIAVDYRAVTLTEVESQAASLRKSYEKAGQSYETLMTAPRRDLGDSIQKAFGNVDDILEDLGLETTELNRRAVRILGYNSMEITPENIARVKAADLIVQDVIQKMTPGAVLQMIRDGKNPLKMNLGELDSYFSEQDDGQQETERYSRYLYQLEQNKAVTEEEKTAYIGVYRMLRRLEKSDGAAVGSVVEQGLELSFSNLLRAVRTAGKGGMDRIIDDNVGGISGKDTGTQNITEQIMTAFRKEVHAIREQLSPDVLKQGAYREDMSVEAFYDAVREEAASEERARTEDGWRRQEASYYRRAAAVSEAAVEELLNYGQPVSADYAIAAQSMLYQRGGLWRKAFEKQDMQRTQRRLQALQERFTGEEQDEEGYDAFVRQVQEENLEAAQKEDTGSMDVREKLLLHKQLSLCRNLAREENYEVPVMVQGKLTSVNLKIIHTPERQGKAAVTMESETYGRIAGEFTVRGDLVSGYLTCDSREGGEYLETVRARMEEGLERQDWRTEGFHIILSKELKLTDFTARAAQGRQRNAEVPEEQKQSANALYRIARLFLQSV